MRTLKIIASAFSAGVIVGFTAGIPSGWNAYAKLNVPAVEPVTSHYEDWQRRDLTREVYWINVEFKRKAKAGKRSEG